jgi:predicted dehydrogenase
VTTRIAIAGAGLIGRRHAQAVATARDVELCAIADPGPVGAQVAAEHGVPHFATLEDLIARSGAEGVIIATPNQLHLPHALACIAARLPALIEKPLATDLHSAEAIVQAGHDAGVPLLTGHHRRHNPLIAKAKQVIDAGDLGQITAVQATTWFYKPDPYFNVEWRRQPGAGPVYLNLSHDIDLLRHLCGEIATVHAHDSATTRGNAVEDTAAILLRFASGALGTMSVSDTIAAPWSWELTARENPMYPATAEACYLIGGTERSLSLPNLSVWSHAGAKSWWEPISETKLIFDTEDPLIRQVAQFAEVIRGAAAPLVSAHDGLMNQRVIEAIKTSARTGQTVALGGA